jgi:hypothetical protein
MDMAESMAADSRFGLTATPSGADVTDASGVARFTVTVTGDDWQLAVHTQAPTADVSLYAGTGIQGQVTWTGPPQSATAHVVVTPPPPPPPLPPPPAVGAFDVRKVLDEADVQGDRDMSGFEFEVTATDGVPIGRLMTAADGRTPSLDAIAGSYTITEVARPSWATGLGDGGPVTFTLEPDAAPDVREVTYSNRVPAASITTSAQDARDGDRVIDLGVGGATIVDTVSHTGLVPGTEYVVSGELMVRPGGGPSPTVAPAAMTPTGITATTTFVPSEPDGDVAVTFAVPTGSPLLGHDVVVYQQLAVASSGRIVAAHTDPDAVEQTLRFADITPTTTMPDTTIPVTSVPATTVPDTTPSTTPESSAPTSTAATAAPETEAPPTSPLTSTAAAAPPSGPHRPPLARTGSDGTRSKALGGVSLMLLGAGLLLAARRPAVTGSPTPARGVSES